MSALLSLVAINALAAAALALVAWAASRSIKRQAVVHGLWLLALLKLVTPPVLPLPVLPAWNELLPAPAAPVTVRIRPSFVDETAAPSVAKIPERARTAAVARFPTLRAPAPAPAPARAASPLARPAAAPPAALAPSLLDRALATAAAVLALGTLAIAALTLRRFRRFRRLLGSATAAPGAVAHRAEEIAVRLGLRGAPPVLLVRAPIPPMLWPSRRGPLLLLPAQLLDGLSVDERDALLAHELAHVRRRDHWVRFVEIAATALFWWYPVAWWARRALRRAEERCCDEWVLRVLPSSGPAYASGLLKSLAFVAGETDPLPIGASGAGPVHDLEARLREILMTRPLPRLAAPVRIGLAAAALAGLAVFPTHAQSRPLAASATAVEAAVVAAGASATPPPADTAPVIPVPARARARAVAPGDARPVVAPARIRGPIGLLGADVAPGASTGFVQGVAGGVAGGVPGGVSGGLPGGVRASADLFALASVETDDPALAAERHALDDQRRKLREQEIDLERRTLELDARAEQKRLTEETVRLRAENRTAEADRVVREVQLNAKRIDLQKQQLQLELEHTQLETRMDQAAGETDSGAAAQAGAEMEHAQQALEERQRVLEAEMEKATQQMQALEAEGRVDELRESTGELERSLAEHIESLRAALPEAGAQAAVLEREIQRLQSALDALGAPAGTKMRTPTPQRMKMRTPQPPPAQP